MKRLLHAFFVPLLLLLSISLLAQDRVVTGKVTDSKDNSPVVGASVQPKGAKTGTSTAADGSFRVSIPAGTNTLVVTSAEFERQEIDIAGKSSIDISLKGSAAGLTEVVVIGYGTARKKDLTGAVTSVQAKDFNKGVVSNPDQLLLGKVAGLQVINNGGQPGAATVIKIRGNNSLRSGNSPLYVIDGIPLDGRSPRPGVDVSGVGATPDINPLNFLNPNDIASMDILKDASSSAIYGSRGANGVILVTTKKGATGPSKVEFNATFGVSGLMRKIDVLDAGEYRAAIKRPEYNAKSDSGATIDPFKEILNENAVTQNYSVALSGGNDNGKYRASFLVSNQAGIIRKTGLKKYIGNFNGQYKFLDKRLSFDFNVTAADLDEKIAPVSRNAGSTGNLISLALIWNPTLALKRANGLYNQSNPSGQVNPMALSDAYNDNSNLIQLLSSFTVGYKITPDLEYKMLYGINYGNGSRKQELQGWIAATGGNADGKGLANIGTSQLLSQTVTHTLSYNKPLTSSLRMEALAGYEYWKTSYKGDQSSIYGFNLNLNQLTVNPDYHYYDNFQAGTQANLRTSSFKDPSVELQSYFARLGLNYEDKYLLTATFRADGSSKFGKNNRYAYFPSVAAAWNIHKEDFLDGSTVINSLKLRVGYGATGNQEFNPVDAALPVAIYSGFNTLNPVHFGNPDLKWETVSSVNVGIDFAILKGRVFGFIDYFNKKTKDPILDFAISQPTAGSGTIYKNLDGKQAQKGEVTNKGFEISLGAAIVEKKDFTWDVIGNITFVKNLFNSPELSGVPFVKNTGELSGQGSTGAYSQVIAAGQPINVFYLQQFLGFDKTTGIASYAEGGPKFVDDPNPTAFYGISTNLTYKKWGLGINMHGSIGNKIYNNTLMSVLNVSNIVGGRNIFSGLVGNGEATANAISPSTRFLEKGDFFKMGNATVSYKLGNVGKVFKSANLYLTGTNLFVITKYTGFDPEVNTDKQLNGIPSLGIDYIGYPTARSITFGVNFTL